MRALRRTVLLVLLGAVGSVAPVEAQSDYRFAAGVGDTFFESIVHGGVPTRWSSRLAW